MTTLRTDREQELWRLAESPEGMLELIRVHEQTTAMPCGVQTEHTTADVGPMIARILNCELPQEESEQK